MKRLMYACLILFLVSGCAAIQENQRDSVMLKEDINSQYIARVEYLGQRIGNRVYWVNPPKQRKAKRER